MSLLMVCLGLLAEASCPEAKAFCVFFLLKCSARGAVCTYSPTLSAGMGPIAGARVSFGAAAGPGTVSFAWRGKSPVEPNSR